MLARRLEYLRKHRYRLLSGADILDHLENHTPLDERSVVFTVDDGYADFAAIGEPVFAAYDCPVIVFLITDFVAGRLWNWFDKVEWAFRESPRQTLTLEFGPVSVSLAWSNSFERSEASEAVIERLKRVRDDEKQLLLDRLADSLEVSYPSVVPERDRAMTWQEVRGCASRGVEFGPHTIAHPILSQVDDERSKREIVGSWESIKAETAAATPIFCYPNGTPADFSGREEAAVAAAGMKAAFSTVELPLISTQAGIEWNDPFAVPRFHYPENTASFVEIASGLRALRAD